MARDQVTKSVGEGERPVDAEVVAIPVEPDAVSGRDAPVRCAEVIGEVDGSGPRNPGDGRVLGVPSGPLLLFDGGTIERGAA